MRRCPHNGLLSPCRGPLTIAPKNLRPHSLPSHSLFCSFSSIFCSTAPVVAHTFLSPTLLYRSSSTFNHSHSSSQLVSQSRVPRFKITYRTRRLEDPSGSVLRWIYTEELYARGNDNVGSERMFLASVDIDGQSKCNFSFTYATYQPLKYCLCLCSCHVTYGKTSHNRTRERERER